MGHVYEMLANSTYTAQHEASVHACNTHVHKSSFVLWDVRAFNYCSKLSTHVPIITSPFVQWILVLAAKRGNKADSSGFHHMCMVLSGLTYSGWWFQPLWKIWVNWGDYSQYMGKCSKPPTRYGSFWTNIFVAAEIIIYKVLVRW